MVEDLIETSAAADKIAMSPRVWDAMMSLRQYLFDTVYLSGIAKTEEPRASQAVRSLFLHYLAHAEQLPPELQPSSTEALPQSVIDYVAGMTDRFAVRDFERLFVPAEWGA